MKFFLLIAFAFLYVDSSKHKSKNKLKQVPDDAVEDPTLAEKGEDKDKKPSPNDEIMKKLEKAFSDNEPFKVGVEGWLRVSSNSFQDPDRYPGIPHPEGGEDNDLKIEVLGAGPSATPLQKSGAFRKNHKFSNDSKEIPFEDAYYFRLSGKNLYFTEGKDDMVVVGAIGIHNLLEIASSDLHEDCFAVTNSEFDEWDLCAIKPKEKKIWYCAIHKTLKPKEKCPLMEEKAKVVEKTKIVKQPLILVPLPSPDCAKDWNYNQHGVDWKCRCNEGLEQSPIDLPGKEAAEPIKVNDLFDYNEVRKDEVKVIYDINMVRIVPISDEINLGQLTDTDGNLYQVSEIQFHTPADHTLLGRKYDMEVQVVHRCIKGDFKNKAVLSILYLKKPGAKVRFFDEIDILNLPNPNLKETEQVISANFNIWKLLYDNEDLVRPPPFNYYKYHGSFAYPPCEENVVWFVVAQPQNLSMTTITFFKDSIMKAIEPDCDGKEDEGEYPDNFDGNNRGVQPLRDRTIYYFDRLESCNPYEPPKKPPAPLGHFEKVEKTASKYYFVQGDDPSGIPGAYVVSEKEARGKLTPQMRITIGNYRETDRYKLHRFKENEGGDKGYI